MSHTRTHIKILQEIDLNPTEKKLFDLECSFISSRFFVLKREGVRGINELINLVNLSRATINLARRVSNYLSAAILIAILFGSCDVEKEKEARRQGEAACPVYATIANEYGGIIELRSYQIGVHSFIGRLRGSNDDILVHDPDCVCLPKPEPCK